MVQAAGTQALGEWMRAEGVFHYLLGIEIVTVLLFCLDIMKTFFFWFTKLFEIII